MHAKLIQLCLPLSNPMDCSPPGSSVHGILQARILEWAAMPSSRGSSQPRVEPRSPALQADSLPTELQGKPHFVLILYSSFPGGSRGKEPTCQCRRPKRCRLDPLVGEIPGGGHDNPIQYSYLESLAGCSPWGHKESDTTEAT